MLSKRFWLKNRSSTILVELTDFPGIFSVCSETSAKIVCGKITLAKQTWATLSEERKKSLKGSKKFVGILYILCLYIYFIFSQLAEFRKRLLYCAALHCNCIALHCLVKLYCIVFHCTVSHSILLHRLAMYSSTLFER